MIYIGIDTGVQTGIAFWDSKQKRFTGIHTVMIHQAMDMIRIQAIIPCTVYVEDARQATFGRSSDFYKAQGAGSVKRDAKIWEDFLTDHNISFVLVRPNKKISKLTQKQFELITGWTGGKLSSHARDGAMIVWGRLF